MLNGARKLFVHVGPAKTGTSAIQYVLSRQDNTQLVYPKIGLWADGSHHNLVFNFFGDYRRPEVVRENATELLARIRDDAAKAPGNVVISSENFAGRDAGSFINALRSALGGLVDQAEIIFVCREHISLAASLYNQSVKDFFSCERRSPNEFLRERALFMRYRPEIERLQQTGFPVRVINYHPSDDLVLRFLRYVGFTALEGVKNEARNVSLSVKGLIGTLAVNNTAGSAEERADGFAALRKMRKFFAPSRFIFAPQTMQVVEPLLAEDRQYLHERFGIELPVPASGEMEDMFHLSASELQEIEAACVPLGGQARKIIDFAARYLR
jgi:hypothetical protein